MAEHSTGSLPSDLGENQIEFVFDPMAGLSGEEVNPLEFAEFVEALVRALLLTDRALTGAKRGEFRYDIRKLSYNSPLTMHLDATRRDGGKAGGARNVFGHFTEAMNALQNGSATTVSQSLRPELLRAYRRVGEASKRSRWQVRVRTQWSSAEVRPVLADKLKLILEDDVEIEGTVEGFLQVINVRGYPRVRVYPHVGPFVTGRLPRSLIEKAKSAVDEYVVVEGTLKYRPSDIHPRKIRVREIHPVERSAPAPYFTSLWGSGRTYRPDLTSLELIQEMRDDWE